MLHNLKIQKVHQKSIKKVGEKDAAQIIEQLTGIPMSTLINSSISQLQNLEKTLAQKIINQDLAISEVAKSIRRARVGLQNSKEALVKIDMSEFSVKHSASRLVGTTAGYVGYENGGQLTEKIRRKPYSVVLFDEIEKAHKDVHNLLLQILEDGELTDGKGRKISFKNTIIILTSNIGAERFQQQANSIGFTDSKKDLAEHEHEFDLVRDEVLKDLKNSFSAEFINRLDKTIVFRPLERKAIKKIVELQIAELEERLKEKEIYLKTSGSVINTLAKIAYKPEYGAREVRRVISERVEMPLVESLVSGKIKHNSTLRTSYDKKNEVCEFEEIK